jgi:hypothetical protein
MMMVPGPDGEAPLAGDAYAGPALFELPVGCSQGNTDGIFGLKMMG